jgi:hypothetical protein
VLFDDVQFLFDELVDDVQGSASARRAGVGTKLVLFSLEV